MARLLLRHLKVLLCQFIWLFALGHRFKPINQDRWTTETAA